MAARNVLAPVDKQPTDAAIVFGSVATARSRKPASVRATCEAVGLPRSTYYYQSHRSHSAIELEQKIVFRLYELRERFPNDGYRRLTQCLQTEGFQVNRKRIARLMQIHGLGARQAKLSTATSHSSQSRAPLTNLLQGARLTGPNQAWLADITYARIRSGLVYTAVVIDVWLREVAGYAVSLQINNRLASIALHSAVRANRPTAGCIHHSTCGSQYFLRGYARLIREYSLVPSAAKLSERPTSFPIIEIPQYESWREVTERSRAFVQAVYSEERIDAVLQPECPTLRLLPARPLSFHEFPRRVASAPAGLPTHDRFHDGQRVSAGSDSMLRFPRHNERSES